MSDKLGNIDYADEQFTYLGPQTGGVNAGPDTHELIDAEVRALVDEGYETAERILTEKRDDLDRLANGPAGIRDADRQGDRPGDRRPAAEPRRRRTTARRATRPRPASPRSRRPASPRARARRQGLEPEPAT